MTREQRERRNERQRDRRRIRRAEDAAFRAREAAEAKIYRLRGAGIVPRIIVTYCPDCHGTREREAGTGVRAVARCEPCARTNAAVREAARREAAKVAAARLAARTVVCLACCAVYTLAPRARKQHDLCVACRALQVNARRAAQQAARVRARSPRHVGPVAPAQVTPAEPRCVAPVARIAVVPCLETYIEQRRVVSVLGGVRELGGGLRLVRVHVWGELRPRDLAVERLGVAA